ncbi:MAG TPA: hypothetical protein VGN26_08990 [Armatimonadota bacterium]
MRCSEVREYLETTGACRQGAWRRVKVRRHLRVCEPCAREARHVERLEDVLRSELTAAEVPADLWAGIAQGMAPQAAAPEPAEALRGGPVFRSAPTSGERRLDPARRGPLGASRRGLWGALALGAASVALLSITITDHRRPAVPRPPTPTVRTEGRDLTAYHTMSAWRDPLADQVALSTIAARLRAEPGAEER